jgi:hypothetical protein
VNHIIILKVLIKLHSFIPIQCVSLEQFFDKCLGRDAWCKQCKISISNHVNLSYVSGSTTQRQSHPWIPVQYVANHTEDLTCILPNEIFYSQSHYNQFSLHTEIYA